MSIKNKENTSEEGFILIYSFNGMPTPYALCVKEIGFTYQSVMLIMTIL